MAEGVGSKRTGDAVLIMVDLLGSAVKSLQHHIVEGKIEWGNPVVELQHEITLAEADAESARLTEEDAVALTVKLGDRIPNCSEAPLLNTLGALTRNVVILMTEPFMEDGRQCNCYMMLPPDVDAEVKGLPASERDAKLMELSAGFKESALTFTGVCTTPAGEQAVRADLVLAIRPLTVDAAKTRAVYSIEVGLEFTEGDPAAWPDAGRDTFFAHLLKGLDAIAQERLKTTPPDRVRGSRPEDFTVAGGYVRPIFGLAKRVQDLPLLQQFYAPQTPLNWAVGLALFSWTDEDRVRSGEWQEVTVRQLTDRVFCLTDRGAPRRGDHRADILAEVVKLHTTRNWYYEVETVRVGRAWRKRAIIGSQYAIPELQLIFRDTKTGKRTVPTDAAVRALTVPLAVKSRRILRPDGTDIPSLPPDRWKLEAIRWRWVQAFNDDLLMAPALVEHGKRKGTPKTTTRGKTIRKGYLIRVARNIFTALHRLRKEGPRSQYACRLLVMLVHNLHRTECGIAADRVFRMLGIPANAQTHRKPEDLVADAVARLMAPDIGALLPTSDIRPRMDPHPDRRKGPYYRFFRSPDYTPRAGITSKEDALAMDAEYTDAEDALPPGPKAEQAVLPGMEAPPAQPIPSGSDIRAARKAAGISLRAFAEWVGHGRDRFSTWARYERGEAIRVGKVPPATWQRVRDFVAQHAPQADPDGREGAE